MQKACRVPYNGVPQANIKIKLEGKPWAPHLPRPSPRGPPPPRLEPRAGGLGILEQTPPRARLPRVGLGRGRRASAGGAISVSPEALQGRPRQGYILRIARGPSLRVARGWVARSPSPPASTDPPDSASCLINASTTPTISAGQWLNATEWPTGPEVASAPYRPLCPNAVSTISAIPAGTGYGGDYRPLCPNAVPTISRPLEASALYTKVSAILGFMPTETPPPRRSLNTDQVSASRAVRPQWLARSPPHPL